MIDSDRAEEEGASYHEASKGASLGGQKGRGVGAPKGLPVLALGGHQIQYLLKRFLGLGRGTPEKVENARKSPQAETNRTPGIQAPGVVLPGASTGRDKCCLKSAGGLVEPFSVLALGR
jgi:hypothetical protein